MAHAPISPFGEIMDGICEALEVNPNTVSRVILDFNAGARDGSPIVAYVEMFVTDKILKIDWANIKSAKIQVLDKEQKE